MIYNIVAQYHFHKLLVARKHLGNQAPEDIAPFKIIA